MAGTPQKITGELAGLVILQLTGIVLRLGLRLDPAAEDRAELLSAGLTSRGPQQVDQHNVTESANCIRTRIRPGTPARQLAWIRAQRQDRSPHCQVPVPACLPGIPSEPA